MEWTTALTSPYFAFAHLCSTAPSVRSCLPNPPHLFRIYLSFQIQGRNCLLHEAFQDHNRLVFFHLTCSCNIYFVCYYSDLCVSCDQETNKCSVQHQYLLPQALLMLHKASTTLVLAVFPPPLTCTSICTYQHLFSQQQLHLPKGNAHESIPLSPIPSQSQHTLGALQILSQASPLWS